MLARGGTLITRHALCSRRSTACYSSSASENVDSRHIPASSAPVTVLCADADAVSDLSHALRRSYDAASGKVHGRTPSDWTFDARLPTSFVLDMVAGPVRQCAATKYRFPALAMLRFHVLADTSAAYAWLRNEEDDSFENFGRDAALSAEDRASAGFRREIMATVDGGSESTSGNSRRRRGGRRAGGAADEADRAVVVPSIDSEAAHLARTASGMPGGAVSAITQLVSSVPPDAVTAALRHLCRHGDVPAAVAAVQSGNIADLDCAMPGADAWGRSVYVTPHAGALAIAADGAFAAGAQRPVVCPPRLVDMVETSLLYNVHNALAALPLAHVSRFGVSSVLSQLRSSAGAADADVVAREIATVTSYTSTANAASKLADLALTFVRSPAADANDCRTPLYADYADVADAGHSLRSPAVARQPVAILPHTPWTQAEWRALASAAHVHAVEAAVDDFGGDRAAAACASREPRFLTVPCVPGCSQLLASVVQWARLRSSMKPTHT